MFEALAAALHIGAAEPLAQPARGRARYHYSRRSRDHARQRPKAREEEKEPEGVWPVLTPEPKITVVPVVVDHATFEQRWAPIVPATKGDRLDRGK
jgi:hypothetical protein